MRIPLLIIAIAIAGTSAAADGPDPARVERMAARAAERMAPATDRKVYQRLEQRGRDYGYRHGRPTETARSSGHGARRR